MARVALLILASLLAYANGFGGEWVYDDLHSILNNPHIRSMWQIWYSFFNQEMFSANPSFAMYRPVWLVTCAINYTICGYNFTGWQTLSILIHALNVVLLYWVVRKYKPEVAFWASLLFAVHPLAAEPVNYISARSDLLAGTFWLLTMSFAMSGKEIKGYLSLFIGLLNKASIATLPIYTWFYGKCRITRYTVVSFGLVGVFLAMIYGNGHLGSSLTNTPRSWTDQAAAQLQVVAQHTWYLLIPYPLSVEHIVDPAHWWEMVAGWWIIMASIWMFRFYPECRLLLLWIILPLVVITIVPLNVLVAERRLYLSLAPICVLLAIHLPRKVLIPLSVVFLCLTWQRNTVWDSGYSLWSDAVQQAPGAARPHLELGMVYVQQALKGGPWDKAEKEFGKAIDLDKTGMVKIKALNNLGGIYLQNNQLVEAGSVFGFLEIVAPDEPGVMGNLGVLAFKKGEFDKAEKYLLSALQTEPYNADLWTNLSFVYVGLRNRDKANWAHQKAIQYD